jgi:hypothetical protein
MQILLYLMPYGRTMQDYVYCGKLNAEKKNGRILDFKKSRNEKN